MLWKRASLMAGHRLPLCFRYPKETEHFIVPICLIWARIMMCMSVVWCQKIFEKTGNFFVLLTVSHCQKFSKNNQNLILFITTAINPTTDGCGPTMSFGTRSNPAVFL